MQRKQPTQLQFITLKREQLQESRNLYVGIELKHDSVDHADESGAESDRRHQLYTELTRNGETGTKIYADFGGLDKPLLLNSIVRELKVTDEAVVRAKLLDELQKQYIENKNHYSKTQRPLDEEVLKARAERDLKMLERAFHHGMVSFVSGAMYSAITTAKSAHNIEMARDATVQVSFRDSGLTIQTIERNFKVKRKEDGALAAGFKGEESHATYTQQPDGRLQLDTLKLTNGFALAAVSRPLVNVSRALFPSIVPGPAYKILNPDENARLARRYARIATSWNRSAVILILAGIALGLLFYPFGLIGTGALFIGAYKCRQKANAATKQCIASMADPVPASESGEVVTEEDLKRAADISLGHVAVARKESVSVRSRAPSSTKTTVTQLTKSRRDSSEVDETKPLLDSDQQLDRGVEKQLRDARTVFSTGPSTSVSPLAAALEEKEDDIFDQARRRSSSSTK